MAASGSFNVHGEVVTTGKDTSSTLRSLTLYNAGSVVERDLLDGEVLHVTDITILSGSSGDVQMIAKAAAGGKYLVNTKIAAGVPLVIHLRVPFICKEGEIPRFSGVDQTTNMCVIQGFIREA